MHFIQFLVVKTMMILINNDKIHYDDADGDNGVPIINHVSQSSNEIFEREREREREM